jgi:hypothetical protein
MNRRQWRFNAITWREKTALNIDPAIKCRRVLAHHR